MLVTLNLMESLETPNTLPKVLSGRLELSSITPLDHCGTSSVRLVDLHLGLWQCGLLQLFSLFFFQGTTVGCPSDDACSTSMYNFHCHHLESAHTVSHTEANVGGWTDTDIGYRVCTLTNDQVCFAVKTHHEVKLE